MTECLSFKSVTWYFSIPVQESLQGREGERNQSRGETFKITGCQLLPQTRGVRGEEASGGTQLVGCGSPEQCGGTRRNGVILMITIFI